MKNGSRSSLFIRLFLFVFVTFFGLFYTSASPSFFEKKNYASEHDAREFDEKLELYFQTAFERPLKRKSFPEYHPDVCICVLSSGRLGYLKKTLYAIISHMEEEEPDVKYEIAWVDNGSEGDVVEKDKKDIERLFQIEKKLFMGRNYGMAFGFNTLFFRLCQAKYILTLEEDWMWVGSTKGDKDRAKKTAIGTSIRVIESDPKVVGVILRPETTDSFVSKTEWKFTSDGDSYRHHCMNLNSGWIWGAYTNGASLYSRSKLKSIGLMYGEPLPPDEPVSSEQMDFPDGYSEANYAFRVGSSFCSAEVQLEEECESTTCNAPFVHIGLMTSSSHSKVAKNPRWLLYGTPYYQRATDIE